MGLQSVFLSSLLLVLPGLHGQETKYVRTNSDVKLSCLAPSGVIGVSWHYYYLDGTAPDNPDIADRDNKYSEFEHSDRILVTFDTVNAVYAITLQAFDGTTDQGRYQCRWPDGGTRTFIVKLAFGPTSVTIHGNKPILAGEKGTLTCEASEAKPAVTFKWSKDGIRIEGAVTSILTLMPVYTDNGASITCVATNTNYTDLTASDTVTLNVQYGVRATTITAPSVVTEGDTVLVKCSSDGNPPPTFSIKGPKQTSNTNTLKITNIDRSDAGDYSCTAINSRGEETKTTNIKVQYPPDVSVKYTNVTENDTGVVFRCFPNGEPQIYTFSPWTHIGPDGHTVIRQLPAESNGGLTLPDPVTYEDSGYYRCTVNNGVTGRSSQLDHIGQSGYFIVGGPPKIEHNEVEGLSLKVWFFSVPEYTSVQWNIVDGSTVSNIDSQSDIKVSTPTTDSVKRTFHNKTVLVPGYITTLTFQNKSAAEFRTYRLTVDNIKGQVVFVKQIGKISEPKGGVESSSDVGPIIGGVVGGLLVVAVIAVLVYIFIRRRKRNGEKRNGMLDDENLGSQGPQSGPGPDPNDNMPLYAEVNKPKKTAQTSPAPLPDGVVYAEVIKKPKQKGKHGKARKTSDNETYQSAGQGQVRNQDGLMYSDVTFSNNLPKKGGDLVVHGKENQTIYTGVDFTKTAAPIPSKDQSGETIYENN
ncbi:hypothetical protein ScPMuIL_002597 [Solemya velum]